MSNYFCINKSGKSVPVYSDTDKKNKIGTIYNREAFGYNRNWGGDDYFCQIVFRNSKGSLSSGFIIDPPNGALTNCTDYPYGNATIKGKSYITFIMRRSKPVYTAGGSRWGAVAANCRVACQSAMAGDSHPEWKGINYVESSKGGWVAVTGDGLSYGFVDAGLSTASDYNSIPMYGSW
ncbi:hypothetical protein LAD12857_07410 [Lacrimispora amygdalina]|uniref:Uncharacterized protein n=1 Tax=Lacrimispora amygdalina TaxID=253257 RepID=A0ABQ5M1L3_9FIRM